MNAKLKLKEVAQLVQSCRRCQLYKTATHGVPGEGNPEAKIMFIGEAPGRQEDILGRPFVGQAGKFLDYLMTLAGLKREEVFITSVVKHRPPQNRNPKPDEIKACRICLDQQITLVDPVIIVTLGKFSLEKFMPGMKISLVHGKEDIIEWETDLVTFKKKIKIIPMYHPAAGLRSTTLRKILEKDFLRLKHGLNNL